MVFALCWKYKQEPLSYKIVTSSVARQMYAGPIKLSHELKEKKNGNLPQGFMFNYTSFRFLSIVAAVLLGAWPKGEKKKKGII